MLTLGAHQLSGLRRYANVKHTHAYHTYEALMLPNTIFTSLRTYTGSLGVKADGELIYIVASGIVLF